MVNIGADRASSISGVSTDATSATSVATPSSLAILAVSAGSRLATRRSEASIASLVARSNAIRVPLMTAPVRIGMIRVAMRSHCRRLREPDLSNTRTGSPGRTKSRSSMDSPGTRPLTSYRLMTAWRRPET